ncbi:Xaa-Pro peptidase family protein [Caulobacter sp. 17J80-11]|uniref:M24 family metallopeptidase n=1 Tax=Caulobacter sp. 17J80-11 TaxID=2763502 RepID=UPI0016538ED5|nr:Xaa-Pro peptidase family protein [Caulobacter sp. 17J80-11]MBC6981856.1 aminopeptidase P family protein [Caulobacter sp. 17J80-11]
MVSRRGLFGFAGLALAAGPALAATEAKPDVSGLKSLTTNVQPISKAERAARIEKAQRLMAERGVSALLLEPGSSMTYFTGVRWNRSERTTAAVIPAKGAVVIVTPAFEEPSVRESLAVDGEVRPWNEHESPFERIAQALADGGAGSGTLAVEATTRFFIVEGVRAAAPGVTVTSGDPIVRGCRMIKSPAELALMQAASDVTLAALRYVHPRVKPGMTAGEIGAMMNAATAALGARPDFALVLLNDASAYPHGSEKPQVVREGGVILMDCGADVHGYQSDISRTWVHGTPSAKQRKVWDTVKRGQEIALATAKLGTPCGAVDDAVRAFYEKEGWGPGYKLPGLSHRTGHGIGMDGHEPSFFVHGDTTPLAPGMCFSDEPGIYIPGEFGIRMEDCLYMTETGPKLFSAFAKSIDDPI